MNHGRKVEKFFAPFRHLDQAKTNEDVLHVLDTFDVGNRRRVSLVNVLLITPVLTIYGSCCRKSLCTVFPTL